MADFNVHLLVCFGMNGELARALILAQHQAGRDQTRPLALLPGRDGLLQLVRGIHGHTHRPQNGLLGFSRGDMQLAPNIPELWLYSPQ